MVYIDWCIKTLVSGSLNSGTHPVPFWCIFAQSAVIRKIYIWQLMMDCYFLERERYVKKKKGQSHSSGGVRSDKTCPWILRRVLDSGKCFGRSGKCFVLMSHGTFRLPCFFQIISRKCAISDKMTPEDAG